MGQGSPRAIKSSYWPMCPHVGILGAINGPTSNVLMFCFVNMEDTSLTEGMLYNNLFQSIGLDYDFDAQSAAPTKGYPLEDGSAGGHADDDEEDEAPQPKGKRPKKADVSDAASDVADPASACKLAKKMQTMVVAKINNLTVLKPVVDKSKNFTKVFKDDYNQCLQGLSGARDNITKWLGKGVHMKMGEWQKNIVGVAKVMKEAVHKEKEAKTFSDTRA